MDNHHWEGLESQSSATRPLSSVDGQPTALPTVSAVIPCYNGAPTIEAAIASALAQTHRLLEIIVVDDGSQDAGADVASRYPVTVIRQKNSGPAAARNAGVAASSGEWVAFLDHDDTWVPDKTAVQLAAATDTIGLICCPPPEHHEYVALPVAPPKPGELVSFEQLWSYNVVGCPSGVLMRRRLLDELGGFDVSRDLIGTEDYNLWQRAALTKWEILTGPPGVFAYTPAHGSLSSQTWKMLHGGVFNVEQVGHLASKSPESIRNRKRFVYKECVRGLIAQGQRSEARKLLGRMALDQETVRLWLRALLPSVLLNSLR